MLRVIRSLADQHTTMIIVTHEMAFARDVADHVIFMDGGTIAEEGTPSEVFGSPKYERNRAFPRVIPQKRNFFAPRQMRNIFPWERARKAKCSGITKETEKFTKTFR